MSITNIDNEITNQIALLENEIKSLDFNKLDFEFQIFESDTLFNEEKLNYSGVYYIELFYNKETTNFTSWLTKFTKAWEDEKFYNRPRIRKKSIKNLELGDNWIPLYIGKSKNIGKRIKQHLLLDNKSATYALKLSSKDFLQNEKIRIRTIKIEVKNYNQIIPYIESEMRKRKHPILGRQ